MNTAAVKFTGTSSRGELLVDVRKEEHESCADARAVKLAPVVLLEAKRRAKNPDLLNARRRGELADRVVSQQRPRQAVAGGHDARCVRAGDVARER